MTTYGEKSGGVDAVWRVVNVLMNGYAGRTRFCSPAFVFAELRGCEG
jgi:hypothetical protein